MSRHTKKLIETKRKKESFIRTKNNSYSKTILNISHMFKKIKENKNMMNREMKYIFKRPNGTCRHEKYHIGNEKYM